MSRHLVARSAAGAAVAALIGFAAGPPADAAAAAPFDPGKPVRLQWDRVPVLDKSSELGAAPAGRVMHVQVFFRSAKTPAELSAVRAMYTPGSPTFHHFLTPAQIGQRYGATPGAVADVAQRLRAAGMTVDAVVATGDAIEAHGSVAAVERAFQVTEKRFVYQGTEFLANVEGPVVMSGDEVGTVVGLDTLARFHTPTRAVAPKRPSASDPFAFDDSTPQALWSVYGMPASLSAKGAGQRLAIIGEGDPQIAVGDLRAFEANFGLPQVPVVVHCPENNSCGPDDSAGDGEWDIDFQSSTAMAPALDALEPYFAQSINDSDLNFAFLGWIQDPNGPRQASASLGECEQTPVNGLWTSGPLKQFDGNDGGSLPGGAGANAMGNDEQAALDVQLLHAAAQGKTLFASTGDAGSFCNVVYGPTNTNGVLPGGDPSPEYPASSAFSVAVGGTVLFTNAGVPGPAGSGVTGSISRVAEYAWEFGGGGNSNFEPAWFYQTDNNHAYTKAAVPCLSSPDSPPPSGTGLQCRGLPDVAAQSGDVFTLNGFDIYTGGSMCNGCGGGTSLSSPLWAGMWTRIQSSNPDPAGYGYANALLYALGENATTSARDFYDVTAGANGAYTALPGWDNVTGWGTPNVANIIADAPAATLLAPAVDVPEAPTPALLALAAALGGGGLLVLRRRRRRS